MAIDDDDYRAAVRKSQAAGEALAGQHRIPEEYQRQLAGEMQRILDKQRAGLKPALSDLPDNERARIEKAARENLDKSARRHITRLFRGKAP